MRDRAVGATLWNNGVVQWKRALMDSRIVDWYRTLRDMESGIGQWLEYRGRMGSIGAFRSLWHARITQYLELYRVQASHN